MNWQWWCNEVRSRFRAAARSGKGRSLSYGIVSGVMLWAGVGLAVSPELQGEGQSRSVPTACPWELETLADRLAQDLPAYANRVSQRSRLVPDIQPSTMIIASRPELEPLPLGGIRGGSTLSPSPAIAPPQQIFLTTLSRSSSLGQSVNLQQFHWLLLSRNDQGWWLVMSFSRTGGHPLT
ncbi:hypothetical protein, partial [Trichothermofontia sp.]